MPFDRVLDRLPPRVRAGLDLAVATVRGAAHDRVTGLAAEIAFWVVLSLPPMLLVAASAAGLIGQGIGEDVRTQLIARIEEFALQIFRPDTVESAITPTLDNLLESGSPSVLSLAFVVAVFSAGRVLRVIVHAVTMAYVAASRPTWRTRLVGLALTMVSLLLGVVLIPVIVAGPRLGDIVERRLGLDFWLTEWLTEIWRFAYWPASLVVLTLLIAGLYHYAVPWNTPYRRGLPGATLATVLGLASGTALRAYTTYAFEADGVYVSLAAPLAVLLWVWLQGMALLLGAELNAEIEKRSPVATEAADPPFRDLWDKVLDRVRQRGQVTAAVRPSSQEPRPPMR